MTRPDGHRQDETEGSIGERHLRYWVDSGYGGPFLYVLQALPITAVKIGYTTDLPARIATLQTGCPYPLRCLYLLPAQQSAETWLHRHLKPCRQAGEWFEGDDVPDTLRSLRATAVEMVADHASPAPPPHFWTYLGWLPTRGTRPDGVPRSSRAEGWENGRYVRYLDPSPMSDEERLEKLRAHWMRPARAIEKRYAPRNW